MSYYERHLSELSASGNRRRIPAQAQPGLVDMSTNDYLGIGADMESQAEFMDDPANRRIAMTSSASRLLASDQEEYERLEALLCSLYGRPALLFNSGYHANTGLVSALAVKGTLILADRLVHASVIDGITLSRAPFNRFRHNDTTHLRQLLERYHDDYDRLLVIVESVYSMDGDTAPLADIAALKADFPKMMLYVDEAHAFGVCGAQGLGLSQGLPVDVVVGTFGKAAASMGAFCVTADHLRDYALNTSRSFIFSTALPPITCAWTRHVINRIVGADHLRQRLSALSERLNAILRSHGYSAEVSHIQPMIIGSAQGAVAMGRDLESKGVKGLPIRVPTVPAGTERIRFSLSAALTDADMDALDDALRACPITNVKTRGCVFLR